MVTKEQGRKKRRGSRVYALVPKSQLPRFEARGFETETGRGSPDLQARFAAYEAAKSKRQGKVDRRQKFTPDERIGPVTAGFLADEIVGRQMVQLEKDESTGSAGAAMKAAIEKLRKALRALDGAAPLVDEETLLLCRRLQEQIKTEIRTRKDWFVVSSAPGNRGRGQNLRIAALAGLGVPDRQIASREGIGPAGSGRAVVEQRRRRMRRSPK